MKLREIRFCPKSTPDFLTNVFLYDNYKSVYHTRLLPLKTALPATSGQTHQGTRMQKLLLIAALCAGGCATPFVAPPEKASAASACNNDPALCRVVVTSNQVYALGTGNMSAASPAAIIMKYDLVDDPASKNAVDPWYSGADGTGKTAYDMTRATGPLGTEGNLGYAGPLGSSGALPQRYIGTVPTNPQLGYYNNWCSAAPAQSDQGCVYGSYGALGQDGPLNPSYYFNQMYHLEQSDYWHGNYNHNLDSAGVWGIQGPLGPTGALAALGPLGPLGISPQAGMTTTADGVYQVGGTIVRQTQPVRYAHDASSYRVYDLVEMYGKSYAKKMGTGCQDCVENDTSFAVDSLMQGTVSGGDVYYFTSKFKQFVSINVVPVNLYTAYGIALSVSTDGGASYAPVASANSNPFSFGSGLMNFIVLRANSGEKYQVKLNLLYTGIGSDPGYYLYVTGSGLAEISNGVVNSNPDLWGPRLQSDGTYRFNINGAHQAWYPW